MKVEHCSSLSYAVVGAGGAMAPHQGRLAPVREIFWFRREATVYTIKYGVPDNGQSPRQFIDFGLNYGKFFKNPNFPIIFVKNPIFVKFSMVKAQLFSNFPQ